MAVDFTYDIGYMGVVKLAAPGETQPVVGEIPENAVSLLATSGSISVEQSPMFSSGVWGAGWYNAADQVAYAPNYVTTSGSVGYELTAGRAFELLQGFAFTERNKGTDLYILPNGKAGYYGRALCQGCSFNASQDQLVTGDFNFKTGNVKQCFNTDAVDGTTDAAKFGSADLNNDFGSSYMDVFPFWATGVCLDSSTTTRPETNEQVAWAQGTKRDDIIDWSASYSSQVVLVATCGNYQSLEESQEAKYCVLGSMSAQGSFTIFRVAADLDPERIRQCRKCTIEMGPASNPSEKKKIVFGSIVFSSGSTDVQTGSSFIQSSFDFTALGNGKNPIMELK